MRDAAIRALRTFVQAVIGAFLATSVLSGMVSSSTIDANALQRAGISAAAAGVIALLSFVQNAVEDGTGKRVLPK
ncbi:MAG: hypothetical protein ACRDHN_19565 [Thermomicrobiales bacterium]